MTRNLKTISADFDSLTIRDFDDGIGIQRLMSFAMNYF
jgi:hypothetical protein